MNIKFSSCSQLSLCDHDRTPALDFWAPSNRSARGLIGAPQHAHDEAPEPGIGISTVTAGVKAPEMRSGANRATEARVRKLPLLAR
jgi:hypothetical protein